MFVGITEGAEMNIEFLDGMIMPIITAACLCIGYVMKKWMPTDDKWIPTALAIFGALSGLLLFGIDYEGVVKGMVSGLAAVGLHQAFKQHMKLEDIQKKVDNVGDLDHNENQLLMAENMLKEDGQRMVKGE